MELSRIMSKHEAVNPLNILFSKLKEIDALTYFRDWLGRYQAGAGGPGESGAVEQNAT